MHQAANNVVLQRVYGEFLEMPGLRLTYVQARRLWGLDEATCLGILELLVERKFLCRSSRGMHARVTEGETGRARPQIVTTGIELIARNHRNGMNPGSTASAKRVNVATEDSYACPYCGCTAGVRLPRPAGTVAIGVVRCVSCGRTSPRAPSANEERTGP